VKLLCLLLLLSSSICAQTVHDDIGPFDKPSTTVLDLGPSPYYHPAQHMRKKLTCYTFASFMIKEYDEGQKGAEWLSVLRFEPRNRPACSLPHLKGEKVIDEDKSEGVGYFKGAKDSFAFSDAADGINAGLPFFVYDTRTGKKVFDDSAHLLGGNRSRASFTDFSMGRDDKQQVVLRYLRVISADCDLKKDGTSCWNQVRAKYGILRSKQPICSGYEHEYDGKWPSAIGYPVSVTLSEHPKIKAVDGPMSCWAGD
jgi:hypothetical protein